MITKNISWSLGLTPNKSLELFEPFIPNHRPGDPALIGATEDSRRSVPTRRRSVYSMVSFFICAFVISAVAYWVSPVAHRASHISRFLRKYLNSSTFSPGL